MIISIVVPSFNQADFLRVNLENLAAQSTRDLQILIADGGSADKSVDEIRRFEPIVYWWASEKDDGQSHALNKALSHATGEWVGWQNSDDCYTDDAINRFRKVLDKDIARGNVADVYFAHANVIDVNGKVVFRKYYVPFCINELKYLGYNCTNQSMFIRRSLIERVGGWDPSFHFAMDADLWFRLYRAGAKFRLVNDIWGAFRVQPESKSSLMTERKSEEWLRLGLREFNATAHLHPYCKKMHFRKLIYLLRRHAHLVRIGRWHSWLFSKISSA